MYDVIGPVVNFVLRELVIVVMFCLIFSLPGLRMECLDK